MPTERQKLLAKQITSQSSQDALNSLSGASRAMATFVERTTAQSISSSSTVFTMVSFSAATSDGAGWFDISAPTRITPTVAGLFVVYFGMAWAVNSTGTRQMAVHKNGVFVASGTEVSAGTDSDGVGAFAAPLVLAFGDYIEIGARQSSGGSLNLGGRSPTWQNPYVAVVKV